MLRRNEGRLWNFRGRAGSVGVARLRHFALIKEKK
jgi:hypothetical protein